MKRRLIPWITTAGLLVLACSGGETPSNDNNGMAGKGTTPMAGTSGSAGSGNGAAGKSGTGGGGAVAGSGGSAGTMAMPSGGTGNAGTTGGAGGTGPAGGAAGATGSAGMTGNAGATGAGAGGASSGGMSGGPTGGTGSGGAPVGGMGGAGGASSTKSYTCNQVIGIDSTSEWYTGGFENQVPNDKWQIIYHHPGYVEDWADPNDEVWGLAPTSPCAANSTNPDRVIFNIYSETLTTKDTLVTAINKAITNFKAKYSRLQRIDILTMTRGPNNMQCVQGNNGSVVQQYVDDAAAAVASAGPPPITVTQKFFAMDCNVFDSGGPHFSDTGKPIVAKIYGDYYSAEP